MLSVGHQYPASSGLPKSLEDSWQRCQGLGLFRDTPMPMEPVEAREVQRILERNAPLLDTAHAELQTLSQALAGTGHIAFVVDDLGFVVSAVGDFPNAGPILGRLRHGMNLSEAICGTNAAGTVLLEKQPTFVRRGQHYLSDLSTLDCFAAPIMSPGGQLLGALTISSSTSAQAPGITELAQIAVARIEKALVCKLKSPLLLQLHPHVEGLGSAAEGLLAVGTDSEVLGLNSAAARMLGVGAAQFTGCALESVFDRNPLKIMSPSASSASMLQVRGGLGISALLERNAAAPTRPAIRVSALHTRKYTCTDLRLVEALSKRELQVLGLLKLGLTNQEIAQRMFLSADSIKYHLKNVFSKLQTKSRLEAVKVAGDLGLFLEERPMASQSHWTS